MLRPCALVCLLATAVIVAGSSVGATWLFEHCATVPLAQSRFDAVVVTHAKDAAGRLLETALRSLVCRVEGLGRVWVVSAASKVVQSQVELVNQAVDPGGRPRVIWADERGFPFGQHDLAKRLGCGGQCGWYLQQLLKLYAGRVLDGVRDYLVVDADVVWYRNVTLVAAPPATAAAGRRASVRRRSPDA